MRSGQSKRAQCKTLRHESIFLRDREKVLPAVVEWVHKRIKKVMDVSGR